jgi:hypothetical protein
MIQDIDAIETLNFNLNTFWRSVYLCTYKETYIYFICIKWPSRMVN